MNRPIHIPFGGPPQVPPPSREIYAHMGEANIFAMLEDFYMELGQSAIAEMFGKDLLHASQKSAAFFVGLLGGPPLYQQMYGSPALRARHMPFIIDEMARVEWLRCFDKVLADAPTRYNFPAEHVEGFRHFLHVFSTWMVNTA
jgi:hemoglobin